MYRAEDIPLPAVLPQLKKISLKAEDPHTGCTFDRRNVSKARRVVVKARNEAPRPITHDSSVLQNQCDRLTITTFRLPVTLRSARVSFHAPATGGLRWVALEVS